MEARTSARQAREATRGGEPPPTVAPWSAEAEVELRRKAESDRDHWKREVGRLREELRTVGATISTSSGTIKFMERQSPQFYKEVKVLRGKLARWDERNWVELCVSALAGRNGEADIDYTHDITDCIGFRAELKRIHARRDESCREWLQANAFRLEKQMLAKMAHRISGRRCGWQNSMFKFDHSARDADGARVRRREMMTNDSSVRAPELFNPAQMRKMANDELMERGDDGELQQRVHVQDADGAGACVRDVVAAIIAVIEAARSNSHVGISALGTPDDPIWIIISMDGAGLSRADSGVRVVVYPGSVEYLSTSPSLDLGIW